jgi:hypothetical protein
MRNNDSQPNSSHAHHSFMDTAISIIAGVLVVPIWQFIGPIGGLSVVLVGIGFGCIWQGRWQSGIPLFASVQGPKVSKPVAFLGFAFIGAIWGGFASEVLDSVLAGAFAIVAAVAVVGAWQTLILKRHELLGKLLFSSASLLFGLGALFAISTFRH